MLVAYDLFEKLSNNNLFFITGDFPHQNDPKYNLVLW